MDNGTVGLVVFIASFIAARIINERALKKLEKEEAARLLKGFSRFRIYSLLGIVVIVVAYIAEPLFLPGRKYLTPPVLMGVLVAFLLVTSAIAFRKLKKLGMPDSYVNKHLLATFIQYTGIFIFFGLAMGEER